MEPFQTVSINHNCLHANHPNLLLSNFILAAYTDNVQKYSEKIECSVATKICTQISGSVDTQKFMYITIYLHRLNMCPINK